MDKIKSYTDLLVWQKSMELVKEVYVITKTFPKEEIYGITNQIRRAAVSIPSNLAEGAARNSNKEFVQYLYVSLGSLAELETQLLLSRDLGYAQNEEINQRVERVRKLLLGLINYLKGKAVTSKE